MSPSHPLDRIVAANRRGDAVGIASICSAHPEVLAATFERASTHPGPVLVEATCNQVNQFGGYTGLTPADFAANLRAQAGDYGVSNLILGGDHLGPNPWRSQSAAEAMNHAEDLVRSYVAAGFTKIHLDCSMACGDDPGPALDPVEIARRAARLAIAAEEAGDRAGTLDQIRYIVGTEVPVPGGIVDDDACEVTDPDDVAATLDIHRDAFGAAGVEDAWTRVIGIVTQPGVEFGAHSIDRLDRTAAAPLSAVLGDHEGIVYEAHSTDYQTPQALADLVEIGFGILKVGPALTFAYREAMFALAAIENELIPRSRSNLVEVLDAVMVAQPENWASYYRGSDHQQLLARRYGLSDRSRYYWPDPQVAASVSTLIANLDQVTIPDGLLSQYLPEQYRRVAAGIITPTPVALVRDRIRGVLDIYADATRIDSI
ncbi:MAG: tagatose-bisphosphate aldolase [Ilumatobacter coccineus]|uniref:Tagatose-bisphosphate aldolase n=1 Tax=Ilumatobacter coccineus TaxID=467094 RepID=A0A2G6K9N0_9ACTN|nr:MAG: tagatose-bisphosphate aldolase [Ilumatobacter coccineus]